MSVFGALNRFIARLDDGPRPKSSSGDNTSFGFQVLRNKNSELPLEPWFDYIVGINGRQIDNPDPSLFANEIRNCSGNSVSLMIWSAKGQRLRDIYVAVPSPSPTLGLTLQWTGLSATQSVWHILEVAPNSPADQAGLLPYGDYIVGSPEGLLRGEAGLGELVDEFLGRPMRLYVYNHEYGVTRTLTMTPVRGWGGEGALGCVLGFGHLHQLPPPLDEPPTAAGETMFEAARTANDGNGNSNSNSNNGGAVNAHAYRPAMPAPGRQTPPPPFQLQADDLSGFSMSPHKGETEAAPAAAPSNFLTPADMLGAVPPPASSSSSSSAPPPQGGPGGRAAGRKTNRGPRSTGVGFDEMFAEGEKRSAEVDNAPKAKSGGGMPPPPKAKSPAPPSGTSTPKPETRSPDPITEEDDE